MCDLLCLPSFTQQNVLRFITLQHVSVLHSFLQPSNIPLHRQMYSSLFIHSFIDGHQACFHLLVIVNSAAMNIRVQIFIWVPVSSSLGYICWSGIAESYGNSLFNFLRNHQTVFSTVAAPFYIPTSNAQVFQFLCILANTCYFLGF